MESKKFMQLVMELARRGEGRVSPNPMVGAIVTKDGKIIGSGYHKRFGDSHAEVNALIQGGKKAKGGTLYVNLEPCSFFGKTPPCTQSIIKAGIKTVYCSILDPNPKVGGEGVKNLRTSGIKVKVGLLNKEAAKFNEVYLKYITTGIPFVSLKIAQTLDGKIATFKGDSKWITSEDSRKFVHRLRSKVDAILVGAGTIIKDDPELTTHSSKSCKNPKRLVLVSSGNIPKNSKVLKNNENKKTIIVSSREVKRLRNLKTEMWVIDKYKKGRIDLIKLLKKAGEERITSILVEGGKEIFTSFLKQKLVDKLYCFISPQISGKGIEVFGDLGVKKIKDTYKLKDVEIRKISNDFLIIGYPNWSI